MITCEDIKEVIDEAELAKAVLTKMRDYLKQELVLRQKGHSSSLFSNLDINGLIEQISHYNEQIKITDADIVRWTDEYNRKGC